jgi:transposase
VHCARTGTYTLLMVHPRRGRQAMEAMGVLPSFTGIAVHDAWAPYDTYAPAGHQLCCAHALRELQAVTDSAPAGRWCWAAQTADALTATQALVSEAIGQGREAAGPAALAMQIHRYRSAALLGARQTAARSGTLMRKHHALARRLLDRQDDYLRFTTDWRIPADNNGSERDIRMTKLSVNRKCPDACAPSPAPGSSASSAATCPPPPSTACHPSARSSCSPQVGPGCQLQRNHARATGT